MKVLANDGISNSGIVALTEAGYTVITEKVNQEDLIQVINNENIEILLVRSATTARKNLIDACPNLKLIGRGGVGMDNIDVEYARAIGRTVINTPGASSQSVAELVMGHFFAISRSLHDSYKNMENGDFKTLKKKYGKGVEIRDKNLTIIGFGRIGQSLASYAIGCGMNVLASDLFVSEAAIQLDFFDGQHATFNIKTAPISEVIKQSDFLTLHVPAQKKYVIGKAEIDQMKDGAAIINAARGGVIDEVALVEALDDGKLAFAGLDTFENEPAPALKVLMNGKISLTPHIGAATNEAQDRIGTELASQIVSIMEKA